MGIFSRLNNVIKSNLNSAIDKAEDPEKLIGQTVVDMKAEVKRAKKELIATLGTAKRLEKKAIEIEAEVEGWENKAVLALRSGDEDLAREALKQKMKSKQRAEDAHRQAAAAETSSEQMKEQLESFERKIDELDSRKGTLASQVRKAREVPGEGAGGAFKSEAFDELSRMGGQIEQMEAEIEAASVLEDPERADVDAKFRKLEKASRGGVVEDELSALKRKLESK